MGTSSSSVGGRDSISGRQPRPLNKELASRVEVATPKRAGDVLKESTTAPWYLGEDEHPSWCAKEHKRPWRHASLYTYGGDETVTVEASLVMTRAHMDRQQILANVETNRGLADLNLTPAHAQVLIDVLRRVIADEAVES